MKKKLISILVSFILVLYPLLSAATIVYATPELPDTPQLPSSPQTPSTPDQPTLSGQDQTGATNNPHHSGTRSDSSQTGGVEDPSSSNTNTGAGSDNNSSTTTDNNTDANINNDANVDNIVSVDSLSGDNAADKNTGDGNVTSGNASVDGSVQTSANQVSLGSLDCSADCAPISLTDLSSGNSQTGSGSDNNSATSANNSNNTGISNKADINNLVGFGANSGNNSASKNTGSGNVASGDADVALTAINTANNVGVGLETFNVYDDQTGDIVIDYSKIPLLNSASGNQSSSNTTTGADSNNNASTTANNGNTLLIDNNGNVINNYDINANTGENSADKNTGDGSVTTGDANVAFNLINFLNNVLAAPGKLLLGVVNIFGTLNGNIVLQGLDGNSGTVNSGSLGSSNGTTGADSSNNAASILSNDTDISLINSANLANNVNLNTTTGNNTADKNTGSGSITSGDVTANLKVTNVANTTTVGNGQDVWMVLINNLGVWSGQLFNTDSSTGVYSPFFNFTVNPDGSISASNQNTGADSKNNASASDSNKTDIAINNNTTLTNNVTINANTGNNSADKNTGSGTIKTGNVSVSANIINLINNTFLGGNFALTIVNVFGKFFGNVEKAGTGTPVIVNQTSSIEISSNGVSVKPNGGTVGPSNAGGTTTTYGSGNSDQSSNGKSALILSENNVNGGSGSPISHFNADPGILSGFRLEYLLIPLFMGSLLVIVKRAIVRR
jgi:hypothetical protein